ncbi:MDR family MFS transporter [Exiguobacterium acetylicum]|uniref:MDR family MFS transporter n=1 Tax=Exiguobacterium acetylicum TaxID=41170 RepID=UPI0039772B55
MRKKVTVALLLATFLAAIEGTIVATATPVMASELNGAKLVSWIFAGFLLFMAVSTPIYGKMADLYGRKRVLLFGIGVFTVASLACGLAQSMEMLIVFRAVQGIGAGAVLPIAMTIIGDLYTYEERGKIQGILSAVWGISGVAGPLVGGFLVESLSWRYIFLLNVPFALLSFFMIVVYYKETVRETERKIDYRGALLFALGMSAFLYGLLSGSESETFLRPIILASFFISFVLLFTFYRVEKKASDPLLPPAVIRHPVILVINLAVFFSAWVLVSMSAYIPIFAQGVLGKSPTEAGFMLMPLSLFWTLTAIIGGRTIGVASPRYRTMTGMGLLIVGTTILSLITRESSDVFIYLAVSLIGIGFGLSQPVFMVVLQTSVDWSLRGSATAVNSFLSTTGQTLGVAIFGTIFNLSILRSFAASDTLSGYAIDPFFQSSTAKSFGQDVQYAAEIALSHGLRYVFIGGIICAVLAFAMTWRLPKVRPEDPRS